MRIACVGYREWALNIYDRLANTTDHCYLIFRSKSQFKEDILRDFKPDLVLFYGWSWIIPDTLIDQYLCLMLHPSPLPKYRGGSPIQNQIIAGEKNSQVSIFVMTNKLDEGDLVGQANISLEGTLNEIFKEIETVGIFLTHKIIDQGMIRLPQNNSEATYFKRRKNADSEISIQELTQCTAEFLYNKIRMLADPYPNAFIRTKDGKKLVLIDSRIEEIEG
jgi:methionyl-tRNA formyltransferase